MSGSWGQLQDLWFSCCVIRPHCWVSTFSYQELIFEWAYHRCHDQDFLFTLARQWVQSDFWDRYYVWSRWVDVEVIRYRPSVSLSRWIMWESCWMLMMTLLVKMLITTCWWWWRCEQGWQCGGMVMLTVVPHKEVKLLNWTRSTSSHSPPPPVPLLQILHMAMFVHLYFGVPLFCDVWLRKERLTPTNLS